MTLARLWRGRRYRALLVGQGVSALGDWMGTFAFMALVLHESGSPTAVGGILALRLFPATIGGPLAARTASRWDRRRTMVCMDIVRAVMIASVPFIRALWWIYLLAFLVEVASLVFLPARDASIPDLVDADLLPLANGLVLGSSYGTIPLGAGAFAAVAALPGATLLGRAFALVFWIDAATFLVSAAAIASITGLGRASPRSPDVDAKVDEESDVRFRDAFAIPLVRAVMPATAAIALGLGALFSLGIVFVREVLHASDAQFGVLIALFGVGAVAGLGALQAVSDRDQLVATRLGATVLGAVVVVFSLAPTITLAYLGAGAFGAAVSWTLASGMGVLQSSLDGRLRVVAFAAFHAVIRSGLAFAAIAAGVAGELVGRVRWPIVGTLAPARLILLCSGLLVLVSAARVRVPSEPVAPERSPHGRRDHH
jgi:predicted MFS family arabinose efflux permease